MHRCTWNDSSCLSWHFVSVVYQHRALGKYEEGAEPEVLEGGKREDEEEEEESDEE